MEWGDDGEVGNTIEKVKRRGGDDYQSIECEKITNNVESRQEVKKTRASERTGGREERQIAKFEIDREQRLGR